MKKWYYSPAHRETGEGPEIDIKDIKHIPKREIPNLIIELSTQMEEAAEALDFERAIVLRDRIREMERRVGKV
jgi:excinuclease ABC subunit B